MQSDDLHSSNRAAAAEAATADTGFESDFPCTKYCFESKFRCIVPITGQYCKPNCWTLASNTLKDLKFVWEKRTGTELGTFTSAFFQLRLRSCPQTRKSCFAIIATHWLRLLRLPKVLPVQMQVLLLQHGRNRRMMHFIFPPIYHFFPTTVRFFPNPTYIFPSPLQNPNP